MESIWSKYRWDNKYDIFQLLVNAMKLVVTIYITAFLLMLSTDAFGSNWCTFTCCKYINNYWGNWHGTGNYVFEGSLNHFIIHDKFEHPSKYIMKVDIDGMTIEANKKNRKERVKSNSWYEYAGTVEYYTEVTFENFGNLIELWPQPNSPNTSKGKKHIAKATIRIAPYKDTPRVYNIFFEGYGLAISLKY